MSNNGEGSQAPPMQQGGSAQGSEQQNQNSHTAGESNANAQRSTYAAALERFNPSKDIKLRNDQVECSVDQIRSTPTDKSRSYRIRSMPPDAFDDYLEANLKSTSYFVVNKLRINGQINFILKIGFDSSKPSYESDYIKSKKIYLRIGNRPVEYVAIEDDQLDKTGTYVPRLAKTVKLGDVPLELAKRPDIIRDKLKDFMEFEENMQIIAIKEGPLKLYKGTLIIPVKKFIEIPLRYVEFPHLVDLNDGQGAVVDTLATRSIFVECKGFDRSVRRATRPPINCNYCHRDGHIERRCPQKIKDREIDNKIRAQSSGFRCNKCHQVKAGCTTEVCIRKVQSQKGEFLSRRDIQDREIARRRNIHEQATVDSEGFRAVRSSKRSREFRARSRSRSKSRYFTRSRNEDSTPEIGSASTVKFQDTTSKIVINSASRGQLPLSYANTVDPVVPQQPNPATSNVQGSSNNSIFSKNQFSALNVEGSDGAKSIFDQNNNPPQVRSGYSTPISHLINNPYQYSNLNAPLPQRPGFVISSQAPMNYADLIGGLQQNIGAASTPIAPPFNLNQQMNSNPLNLTYTTGKVPGTNVSPVVQNVHQNSEDPNKTMEQ